MKKKEMREVEVEYCDICGKEKGDRYLDGCAVCKREICGEHRVFSVELYRHSDRVRLAGFGTSVCTNCAANKFNGTIQELFAGMINRQVPVVTLKD